MAQDRYGHQATSSICTSQATVSQATVSFSQSPGGAEVASVLLQDLHIEEAHGRRKKGPPYESSMLAASEPELSLWHRPN